MMRSTETPMNLWNPSQFIVAGNYLPEQGGATPASLICTKCGEELNIWNHKQRVGRYNYDGVNLDQIIVAAENHQCP